MVNIIIVDVDRFLLCETRISGCGNECVQRMDAGYVMLCWYAAASELESCGRLETLVS
jgi:hypothetical protein